ncbi:MULTISPECIES: hypothetical protein [Citrobacter]|uniref:Uncharacterized protein n=1 Tax=Citrobacter telavivensis TaxID=2653932 RepID=A0A6L5EB03_9ENTR|nr:MULTISPECIES: hypothetical protein [Citrobacter]MPQ52667.1 hypothetical protein [Citrobacter telavivensis]QFS69990.1 hypothetical protein GBC03_07120 [Citrobacter telavivensis]CAI9388879.1 hypothetical protein CITSP_00654 [Citrobacter sp. T1.2D-1]
MLQAILNGKARRVSLENGDEQSWRSVFQRYEDLLTAAFWGRISYLSEESLHTVLTSLLDVDVRSWGKFESIVFWPKYDFPPKIDDHVTRWVSEEDNYAEPDVILNFTHAALLVEVKPPTGGQQYQQQWCKEIYGWQNSEDQQSTLHFLALGNLPEKHTAWFAELKYCFPEVTFHGLEWRTVREKIQYSATEWATQQEGRIIQDCLNALALYGIHSPLQSWQPLLDYLSSQNLPTTYSFFEGNSHV